MSHGETQPPFLRQTHHSVPVLSKEHWHKMTLQLTVVCRLPSKPIWQTKSHHLASMFTLS